MTDSNEQAIIGYLYNFIDKIKIPLTIGKNIIKTNPLFKNSKLYTKINRNIVIFGLNIYTENKATLRSYESFPLLLKILKDNQMEEFEIYKNGVFTLENLTNLEITIFYLENSIGTFYYFKNECNLSIDDLLRFPPPDENMIIQQNSYLDINAHPMEYIDIRTEKSIINDEAPQDVKRNENLDFSFYGGGGLREKCDYNLKDERALKTFDSQEETVLISHTLKKREVSIEKETSNSTESHPLNSQATTNAIPTITSRENLMSENCLQENQFNLVNQSENNFSKNPNIIRQQETFYIDFQPINFQNEDNSLIDEKYKITYTKEYLIIPKILLNFDFDSCIPFRKIKQKNSRLCRKRKRANSKESHSSHISNKEILKSFKKSKILEEKVSLTKSNDKNIFSNHNGSSEKSNKDTNQCTICLDKIDMPSKLLECEHFFCKECIDQWAKKSSTCPLCKMEFQKIIYYDMNGKILGEKKIKKKIFIHKEEHDDEWLDNTMEQCMKCNNLNDAYLMLVCDKCKFNVCHTYCAGLEMIPDEDWYCFTCNEDVSIPKRFKAKQNKIQNKFDKSKNNKFENHKSLKNSKISDSQLRKRK